MNATHRITAVLVSAPLMLGLGTAVASADQPSVTGQNDATEPKVTGPVDQPVGTVSQFAHALKDVPSPTSANGFSSLGDHSNNFAPGQRKDPGESATGRLGVGNVARSDSNLNDPLGLAASNDSPNSHFAAQTEMDGLAATDPSLPPGNNTNPKRNNPNG
jgi:hypothetical protein